MINHNQDGAVNGIVISLVLTVLILVGAVGFGVWAYGERQDYKNNVDQKISIAVSDAEKKLSAKKDLEFAEKAKDPFDLYTGPEAYGSLKIEYPKTWSGYVEDTGSGSNLVEGYFAPGVVPDKQGEKSTFALRVQVINERYSEVVKQLDSQVKAGKLTISAYSLPKLPKVVGIKADGQLSDQKTVHMVVLPLRSETVQIWTEGDQYLKDFNENILPNFSFSP